MIMVSEVASDLAVCVRLCVCARACERSVAAALHVACACPTLAELSTLSTLFRLFRNKTKRVPKTRTETHFVHSSLIES